MDISLDSISMDVPLTSLPEEEYKESYDEALKNYDDFIKENKISMGECNLETTYETENKPMHPTLYYQLIHISGFTNLNGNRYHKYLNGWIDRKNKCPK